MNIIFMGSGKFGELSLRALVKNGHRILCVVTQPDKKQNRGMQIEATPIKKAAIELGLAVFQPVDVNTAQAVTYLKNLKPEIFVVVAYGQKLSQAVLDIPSVIALNIHASLLPAYRGAAPINWAIIRGEKITGVTLMKVALRMDTGPVIMQKLIDILEVDTAVTLADKLAREASDIIIDGINQIATGSVRLKEQDESKASFAPKLKRSHGLIEWNNTAQGIVNLIKGCAPWPGAYTYYKGKTLKVHKACAVSYAGSDTVEAGQIVYMSKEGIVVACAGGSLLIETVQMEGKRIISAREFIAGYKVNVQDMFG
jgi:methionyl-tRNA formyltransferase